MPTCTTHIGRMSAIGIAKETTAGTPVNPTIWIPVETAEVTPIIKTVEETAGFGVIDRISDIQTVENTSETTISGAVRSGSIGHILLATLGTVSAPTLVETGVYRHDFSRLNSNCPVTYTITEDTPVATKQAPYSVIDNLSIEAKAGDFLRFSAKYQGGQLSTVTDATPSYSASEKKFLSSGLTLTRANDVAGLESGTAVKCQSFKLDIAKNLEKVMALGSTNIASIQNTTIEIKGDMELVYDSETMAQMVVDGTKQAIKLVAQSSDLIGATKKAELTITLARVAFSEWKKSNDSDKIVTQTVGFVGTLSLADAMTISMSLQNTTSSAY